tara:strand:- start:45 stop:605 length:561 start_codon:yes stop_codon:yes gene_type:complete
MKFTRAGTIYVVKNPHYVENYYKVGKTSRTAEDRLGDEDSPSAFSLEKDSKVIAEYAVYDLNKVESLIHQSLSEFKIDSDKKEWFKIELTELKKIIKKIVNENNYREFEEPPTENNSLKEGKENFNKIENVNNVEKNNEKRKGGRTFKFLGIILLLVGVGGLPFGALGGASIFLIIIGIIMYFTFK